MEYGIWSLHVAGGFWADPRFAGRHPILPPSVAQALPRAALALNAFQRPTDMLPLPLTFASDPPHVPMELVAKPSVTEDSKNADNRIDDEQQPEDNEADIEKTNYQRINQTSMASEDNENEDAADESDAGSTTSSHPSTNNNFPTKHFDLTSGLFLDKEESVTPILNGWVLGAYTAMLGRLSAATAALEGSELPNVPTDSDSESEHSSYTEKSRGSSPNVSSIHCGYSCGSCETIAPTRPALRKHIADNHPAVSVADDEKTKRCPSAACDFLTNNTCHLESHVAGHVTDQNAGHNRGHVTQGITSTGKKRSLALQRVRYEREEYRCSLCSYACTIEKAFQRHLRAHARGNATETRVSCAVCGADRSSEVELSRHMRRHRDDRYFCCDICIFRTVQLKKLIQHRRMHTGEKPHLCPHCAYRSARRDNLRSHVRRVHKKENLYCDTFSPRDMLLASSIRGREDSLDRTTAFDSPNPSPASNDEPTN